MFADQESRVVLQVMLGYCDLLNAVAGDEKLRVRQLGLQSLQPISPKSLLDRIPQQLSEIAVINPETQMVELIQKKGLTDPSIRYAASRLITQIAKAEGYMNQGQAVLEGFTNSEVRLVYLLAARRLADAGISRFLHDPNPRLILEAARAINDVPIPAATPELAALLQPSDLERLQSLASGIGTQPSTRSNACLLYTSPSPRD